MAGKPDLSVEQLVGSLEGESERGAVVMAANFITDLLKELLLAHFRHDKPGKDLLNEANAPLASLSAVAKLSRALDLVTAGEFRRLMALRQIRNDFAHGWSDVSLRSGNLRKPLQQLGADAGSKKAFSEAVCDLAGDLLKKLA